MNTKITEWCQHCDTEVELDNVFKVHVCPNCGARILPCSMCDWDVEKCNKCPLSKQTDADHLYEECWLFWQRQGIEKEDNLMACAMYDVVTSKEDGWETYNIEYYLEKATRLWEDIAIKIPNHEKGKNGFLIGKGY